MNRRQKIIVSITGIFIILLALVGLTYAYFLTRITGNENDKSISVTTANLELVYGDGNNLVTAANIEPGDPITPKTFTVTNNGNATVEGFNIYLEDVRNSLSRKTDMIYTITCVNTTEGATSTTCEDFEVVENDVNEEELVFPSVMNVIARDTLEPATATTNAEQHTYTITLTYKEMNVDQSEDMNKEVSAKVNIYDSKTKFLATEIINNAKSGREGATVYILPSELPTKIGVEGSYTNHTGEYVEVEKAYESDDYFYWTHDFEIQEDVKNNVDKCTNDLIGRWICNNNEESPCVEVTRCEGNTPIYKVTEEIINAEKTLSYTYDDLGTSYYYRGNVEDNYVNFAGMCWRIVRIEGDGSIKLILEDQDQLCDAKNKDGNFEIDSNWNIATTTGGYTGHFGYNDGVGGPGDSYMDNYFDLDNSSSMSSAFNNFQKTFTSNELSKLKSGNWCYNDTAYSSEDNRILTKEEKESLLDTPCDYNNPSTYGFSYDTSKRIETSNIYTSPEYTLKCNGTIMNDWQDKTNNSTPMYIGTLTADEMAYAGAKLSYDGFSSDYDAIGTLVHYLTKNNPGYKLSWWSLSPVAYYGNMGVSRIYMMHFNGNLTTDYVTYSHSFRPSIILKSDSTVTINLDIATYGLAGTRTNPYVIN